MRAETKTALIEFSAAVSDAIARQANGKDADWQKVIEKSEALENAVHREPSSPPRKETWPEPRQTTAA